MTLPFSDLTEEKINGMLIPNRSNLNILKKAAIARYHEIERLQAVIGNVSYLICIFSKHILMIFALNFMHFYF